MEKPLMLIVETDEAAAAEMEHLARRAGFVTAVDTKGAVAHTLARNMRPCCVLLDVAMPEKDGRDILWALKSDPATREIPVVMIANEPDFEVRHTSLALGACDVQPRPPSAVFFQRVARWVLEDDAPDGGMACAVRSYAESAAAARMA
jgi:CheY-like chemotaxis protein